MDYIHIDNLYFSGKHGYYVEERKVEQEFAISIKLGFDTKAAGLSDDLNDTLDYQKVKSSIETIIKGNSRYLIEKLAEEMAAEVLRDKRIQSAEVTIRKVAVWDNGVPGVTIVRAQE